MNENNTSLLSGIFEITHRCNLKCLHCYLNNSRIQKTEELSFEDIRLIVDQLVNLGVLGILITGGEPLIRKDFVEIYKYIYDKKVVSRLFTNGTLFDTESLDTITIRKPHEIEISIYAGTPEGYNHICSNSNAYYNMIDTVKYLLKNNFNLKMKSVIFQQNLHELPLILELVKKLGLSEDRFRFDTQIYPTIKTYNKINLNKLRLSQNDILFTEKISNLRLQQRINIHNLSKKMDMTLQQRSPYLFTCGAGRTVINISPNGIISPCGLLNSYKWSYKDFTIKEIWNNKFEEFRNLRRKNNSKCNACKFWMMCSNCPAKSEMECGDLNACVPYYCENNLLIHKELETYLSDAKGGEDL